MAEKVSQTIRSLQIFFHISNIARFLDENVSSLTFLKVTSDFVRVTLPIHLVFIKIWPDLLICKPTFLIVTKVVSHIFYLWLNLMDKDQWKWFLKHK